MRLSTPPLIVLSLLGAAALLRPALDEYLADRDRRDIRHELAERGRIRAENDIAHGVLRWPDPCTSPVIATEWCRLYGVECSSPPPGTELTFVYRRVLGRSGSSSTELHVYDFFMAAHISRLVGEDGLEYMRSLERFVFANRVPSEATPNPGMQRTRYARR